MIKEKPYLEAVYELPELALRAEKILRQNDAGGWTKPAPNLYPHQWSWDSAFIVIGLAHLDGRRAALRGITLSSSYLLQIFVRGRLPRSAQHIINPPSP